MKNLAGKYYIENGVVKPIGNFSDNKIGGALEVYEVLRVISGVPLFLEGHLSRLQHSMLLAGWKNFSGQKTLIADISELINQNKISEGNIKLSVVQVDEKIHNYSFLIPHSYPTENEYRNGVEVKLINLERINPEAKITQAKLREKANELLALNSIYEVLLVDNNGFIREGSRTNVFFVKENQIITPPGSLVLNGITRQKVIEIIKNEPFDFIEKQVSIKELNTIDCLFLTGTSPKVLPVRKIGKHHFNVENNVYISIKESYDKMVEKYISG